MPHTQEGNSCSMSEYRVRKWVKRPGCRRHSPIWRRGPPCMLHAARGLPTRQKRRRRRSRCCRVALEWSGHPSGVKEAVGGENCLLVVVHASPAIIQHASSQDNRPAANCRRKNTFTDVDANHCAVYGKIRPIIL